MLKLTKGNLWIGRFLFGVVTGAVLALIGAQSTRFNSDADLALFVAGGGLCFGLLVLFAPKAFEKIISFLG